jgi:triacylglycerol lipase
VLKKKIPPLHVEALFPPVSESEAFTYFENFETHPFRHDAAGFELVNAWWLAEASLLAYSPGDEAVKIFRRAGLEAAGGGPIKRKGTQCYVLFNDRIVIAAFRGTEVLRPDRWGTIRDAWSNLFQAGRDAGTDAKFVLRELSEGSGRFVHHGFLAALDDAWADVENQLTGLKNQAPSRTFWFTGHSLGAALATLAADRFQDVRGLYTYGCPMVGDASFAGGFRVPAFRFVNNTDIVPRVPPVGPYLPSTRRWGLYEHVGHLKYIDAAGQLVEQPGRLARLEDRLRGRGRQLLKTVPQLLRREPLALAPKDLNDHAPLLYAVHVWNIYASGR